MVISAFFPGFVGSVEPSEAESEFAAAPFPLQHLRAGEQLVRGAVGSAARLRIVGALLKLNDDAL